MTLGRLNGRGDMLANYFLGEAWPGGEIPCVYGLAPGIHNWAEAGPVHELYQGGQRAMVVYPIEVYEVVALPGVDRLLCLIGAVVVRRA